MRLPANGRRHGRSLARTVALAAAADDALAERSRHLAIVIADVEPSVQLEEVEAPVEWVRVEYVLPHGPASPIEADVPRLVDHRLVPRVSGGQHLLIEQTLRAAEVFLKQKKIRK